MSAELRQIELNKMAGESVFRAFLLVALSGVVLSGCAPGRFDKATTTFSTSVTDLSTAMNTSLDGLAKDDTTLRNQTLLERRVVPELSVSCLSRVVADPNGERLPACGIVAERGQLPEVRPVWRQTVETAKIIDSLAVYAKGLQELTSADSRKQIDDAVDAITVGISGALTLAGHPEAALPAAAAIKLGGFAYAETQDARRYRQLQRSVEEGQAALVFVGPVLAGAFTAINQARTDIGVDIGNGLSRAVRPSSNDYPAAFAKVSAQAAQIETLQRADPAGAVASMLRAHKALATALEENKGETLAVAEAMAEFAKRATAFQAAIEAAKKGSS